MYILMANLTNDLGELISTRLLYFDDLEDAKEIMELLRPKAYPLPDNLPEVSGRIVTPLPPGREKKAKGVITPKPPLQFAREQQRRLSTLPEDLKDESE